MLAASPAVAQRAKADVPLASLEGAARSDSNDPAAHFNLGFALFKARRYHDAEQSLRTALMIDPQYAPALMLLARANEAQNNSPLAFAVGRGRIVFMRLDPNANENTFLRRRAFLIDPLLEIEPPNRDMLPSAWRGTLGQGLYNYDHERWSEAITSFQTVIDRTTRSNDSTKVPPVALWFRARCAMKVGDFDGTLRYLQWLLSLRMQDSTIERMWNPFAGEELRYILAFVHQQARRWDEAIRRYQALVEENLALDAAHTHLAEIYEAQSRWPEAVEERVRAIHANPDGASVVFNLGSTLTAAGRYAEAEPVLERYAAGYPREARAFYLLGLARMGLGKSSGAREAFTQFLALAPRRYDTQIADAKERLATLGP
ncbi:MAG TPA: tetratricopeptide repeat protein [Gemmatimonadales bacterium]|jgi:tetratricopeptide (TPR) repeat protein|nr:tetratricopeptide repeat protein [Gemmatimonadales bacterium]